jgi:cytochrome c peroxidase
MLRAHFRKIAFSAFGLLALTSCKDDDPSPTPADEAFSRFEIPPHFPPPVYDFSGNPITEAGFELGRKLFFDPRLSRDGSVSCGSCHAQVHAFADHGTSFSSGVDGLQGLRNAPATTNLAWVPHFMWDGGINHIEVMPIAPLTDPLEMDNELPALMAYLNNETEYPALFKAAFDTALVSTPDLLLALAQFQGSIVSARSKYDDFISGKSTFSESEARGLEVFEAKCTSCHVPPLFSDFGFRNNGLHMNPGEQGRMRITGDSADFGKVRVPSLRNVRLTQPYMHDGRFFTLEQVLEHYSSNLENIPNLDPQLQGGIGLSEENKADLLSFLNTLSDFELLGDMRFSEP